MTLERQRLRSGPVEFFLQGKNLIADQFWLFMGMTVLGSFIGSAVPLYPLLGAAAYGVFLAYRTKERGGEVRFDLLFKGFDKLGETITPSLVYGGGLFAAILAVMLPLVLVGAALAESDADAVAPIVLVGAYPLMGLVSVLLWMPFTFAFQLILDRELSGMAAVGESWRAVRENFGKVFLVNFLTAILYVLGIVACCVGWAFALPIIGGAHWLMYREIYPDLGMGEHAERWARESAIEPQGPPKLDWSSESE